MTGGSRAKRDAAFQLDTVGTLSEEQMRDFARGLGQLLARAALRAVDQGRLVVVETAEGRAIVTPQEAEQYIKSRQGERTTRDD